MRNRIRRLWAKWRLHKICKALGIKPFPEAVAYVLYGDGIIFRGGRCNGKTMTLILDELVYKRVPEAVMTCDFNCRFCRDPDRMRMQLSERWYLNELKRAVILCERAGIDVGRGWKK